MTDSVKYGNSQVSFLSPSQLQPNPFQPREKMIEDDDFLELVESVKQHGVLEPLVVVKTPAGLHIIAGERRWRAAKKNKLEKVPVHIVKTTPKGMLEMAIVENVQRVNLSALEKAQAFLRLINEFGYTQKEIGEKIGKSRSYIQCSISLLELPDPIKDGLNRQLITEGHARAILTAGNEKNMMTCYKIILNENASVRRAEALARFYRRQEETRKPKSRRLEPAILDVDKYVDLWQKKWQAKLKSRTAISMIDSNAGTKIMITLKGDAQERKKDLDRITKLVGLDEKN
ncbi:MAG: ParB/RepB/Spo0J family partition protein [bacterium]|nr:ParB/RepB/Spo0J family partition protein [bacterium]